jgi:hypothetical protein
MTSNCQYADKLGLFRYIASSFSTIDSLLASYNNIRVVRSKLENSSFGILLHLLGLVNLKN